MSFIYVGGVPGAGKTFVSSSTANILDNCTYISSGEIKLPESLKRFGKKLSILDQKESFEINGWFFDKLKKNFSKGLYLVDTHYTYPLLDRTFVKLLPERCVVDIDQFVLFEAGFKEIIGRRVSRGRERDSIDYNFIKKELDEEKIEAIRLSEKFSIPLEIFDNNITSGLSKDSVYNFQKFLKTKI